MGGLPVAPASMCTNVLPCSSLPPLFLLSSCPLQVVSRLAQDAVAWSTSVDGVDHLGHLQQELEEREAAITAAEAAAAAAPAAAAARGGRARRANANRNPAALSPAQLAQRAAQVALLAAQAAAAKAAEAAAREAARVLALDRVVLQRAQLPPQTVEEWEAYAQRQVEGIITYLKDAFGDRHAEGLKLFKAASLFHPDQLNSLQDNQPEILLRLELLRGIPSLNDDDLVKDLIDELPEALRLAAAYVSGTRILSVNERCVVDEEQLGGGQTEPRLAVVMGYDAITKRYSVHYDSSAEGDTETVAEGRVQRTDLDVLNYHWQRREETATWYKVRAW